MSRFLRASSPQWIAASIFLPSPHTLAGVARRRPVGASSSFRSGKPALSSCSKSAMTKYSFWRREHSGRRITASLDRLSGALSDRPNELLRVRRRRRLDLRCRPGAAGHERPVSGESPIIEAMKTPTLLAVVLVLQIAVMVLVYGSHVFGIRGYGFFGFATWLLLPLAISSLACSQLLKRWAWPNYGRYPEALKASMSIGLPLLALFVGVFACLNAFGE